MTDAVVVAVIGGATTIISALLAVVVAKLNTVKAHVDGRLEDAMKQVAALSGEIRRLAPAGAAETGQPGSGSAVMLDRDTGTITQHSEDPR